MKPADYILKITEQFSKVAAATPEYLRDYMKNRYHAKRKEITKRLGGKCVRCGSNVAL